MKKNVLFLLMFVFLLSFYGCGDSIYSDAADTGTYEAKQDQLDFDFISNNCAPVIDYYNNVDSSGASLTRDDAFKFLSAILYCGGFNVIGGIDMVTQAGTSDVYGVVAAMLGISEVTSENLKALSPYYSKAVNICSIREALAKDNNTSLDNSTASICGFAGMIGSAVNVSSLISSIAGENVAITISENGFKQALEQIDVNTAVDEFLANTENAAYLDDLTLTLNTAFGSLSSMESLLGGSTDMVNDIKGSLLDEITNQVSADKLKEYITSIKETANNNSSGSGSGSGNGQGNGQGNGGR